MILASKITRLRKQLGWSQEELAHKMDISRQSVSKWESTNSIPDLNKIIKLAEIFSVSTDYLLKDEIEELSQDVHTQSSAVAEVDLEKARSYIKSKGEVASNIAKGVVLCVSSVIPLLFLLAMADTHRLNLTNPVATVIGITAIVVFISVAISFFLKANQHEELISSIEDKPFELSYGVHSIFKEKLQQFKPTYNLKLTLSIFLFISSFLPLMISSIFFSGADIALMMVIVLLLFIVTGLYIIIPVTMTYDAYHQIIEDKEDETEKSLRAKRAEKLAAFYWPFLTAIYLGVSLWTMAWGATWIIWPVGAVLFAALVGLRELFVKEVHS
ncbi:MAG: helix-turn-helix domain-containing protein [Colwellia sp.]